MNAHTHASPWQLLALSLVVFVLHGCTANLPTVRDFSQRTIVAAQSFDGIADDLPKSCQRRVELALAPDEKVEIVNGRVEYTEEYLSELAQCQSLQKSLDGILAVTAVLKAYAEALGKLASDDT